MNYFNTHFFNLSSELYLAIDLKNQIRDFNLKWPEVSHYSSEELLCMNIFNLIHPEDLDSFNDAIEECKKGIISGTVFRLTTKSKSYKWMKVSFVFDNQHSMVLGTLMDVGEPKNKLVQLEKLIDTLPISANYLDKDLNFIYANKMSKDDTRDKTLIQLLSPYFQNALSGEKQTLEMVAPDYKNNDTYNILHIVITPNENSQKIVTGLYLFIHDVTEIKNNENLAIEKEKKIQALFNSLNQGIVLHDSNGKITEFNPSALKILGLTKDQLLGKTSFDPAWKIVKDDHSVMLPEEHPSSVAFSTGLPVIAKMMGVHLSSGEISWVSTTAIPLFQNNEKNPHEVLVTFEDLTKTQKLKEELKEKSFWKDAILNGTDYSIIAVTQNGIIKTFNKRAEQMLGYSADEVVGKHSPLIFHLPEELIEKSKELSIELGREIKEDIDIFVAKSISHGPQTNEWTYRAKDGTQFPVKLCVTAITDENNHCIGFMGVAEKLLDVRKP